MERLNLSVDEVNRALSRGDYNATLLRLKAMESRTYTFEPEVVAQAAQMFARLVAQLKHRQLVIAALRCMLSWRTNNPGLMEKLLTHQILGEAMADLIRQEQNTEYAVNWLNFAGICRFSVPAVVDAIRERAEGKPHGFSTSFIVELKAIDVLVVLGHREEVTAGYLRLLKASRGDLKMRAQIIWRMFFPE